MKIAYLSTFYPYRGGIAQFNAALYRYFEKEHEIRAYTFTRQYPDFLFPGKTQMVQENDNAGLIPSMRVLDTINPLSYIKAGSEIAKFKPDLMITKFWMPFFAPSFGYVAGKQKRKGTKNISILDNVIPHEKRPADIALTKYFLNKNHGFMVMSESVKNDLLLLTNNAQYSHLPHPLYDHFGKKIHQAEARQQLNLPKDKKILLFFGFIRDYKGLDVLINSVKLLGDEYFLVIAGEVYGDFAKYDKLIDETGISNKTKTFVRYINDNEVPAFFSAADVCVQPYKSATQSGIVGISFHFDLPIIATDVGGLKETIEPYGTGIMVEKPEPEMFARAIQKYFKEINTEEMIDNIKTYKQICSWENFGKGILELYDRIK